MGRARPDPHAIVFIGCRDVRLKANLAANLRVSHRINSIGQPTCTSAGERYCIGLKASVLWSTGQRIG